VTGLPPGWRVTTYERLDECVAGGLGTLAAGLEAEWSPEWLGAEEGRTSDLHRYVLVTAPGGRPVAAASCQRVLHTSTHTAHQTWETLLGRTTERLVAGAGDPVLAARLAELRARLPRAGTDALVASLPGSTLPGLAWDGDPGAAEPRALVEALVAEVERVAAELGVPIVAVANVRDEPPCADLHSVLGGLGYRPAVVAADAVLDVVEPSFEAYVAGLPRKRRQSIRRERRAFLDAGVSVVAGGPELLGEDLVELQRAQYARHGHVTSAASVRERFRRLRGVPGLRVMRAAVEGRTLGYVGFLHAERRPGRISGRYAAFVSNTAAAYFNLTYYELVRYAIEAGARIIHYGRASYAPKVFRGCRLVPLTTYVRTLGPHQEALGEAAALRDRLERARLASFGAMGGVGAAGAPA